MRNNYIQTRANAKTQQPDDWTGAHITISKDE